MMNFGKGDPQLSQNTASQPSGIEKDFVFSDPLIHFTFPGLTQNTALDPVPDTFLHFVQ